MIIISNYGKSFRWCWLWTVWICDEDDGGVCGVFVLFFKEKPLFNQASIKKNWKVNLLILPGFSLVHIWVTMTYYIKYLLSKNAWHIETMEVVKPVE